MRLKACINSEMLSRSSSEHLWVVLVDHYYSERNLFVSLLL